MSGDIKNLSTSMDILIRFDAAAHAVNPDHSVRYSLFNDTKNQIHKINDFSRATDEELFIGSTTLRAVLFHLELEEHERDCFKKISKSDQLSKEINELTGGNNKKGD